MIEEQQPTCVPLTEKLTKEWAKIPAIKGDRLMNDAHLEKLDKLAQDKKFIGVSWAKAIIEGKEYRLNGQHSYNMILEACKKGWKPVGYAVIRVYKMEWSDLPDAFDLFDSRNSVRTASDKLGTYICDSPLAFMGLTEKGRIFGGHLISGISAYRHDRNKQAPIPNPLLATHPPADGGMYFTMDPLMAENVEFVQWLNGLSGSKHRWMFAKPTIVAEMYADFLSYKDAAIRYWTEVLEESNPDPNHETREISRKLLKMAQGPRKIPASALRDEAGKSFNRFRKYVLVP